MSYSQEPIDPFSDEIKPGPNKWYSISFYHDPTVVAKILSVNEREVVIYEKRGIPRKVDRYMISNIKEKIYGKHGSVGLGFGIPYGVLGINAEYYIIPYLSCSGGIGTTLFAGLGYSVGARGYVRKPGHFWRPRASLFYGINGFWLINNDQIYHPENEKFRGLTIGLGQLFQTRQHGLDLDLMYIINSELYQVHPGDYVRLKISVGYRYAF